MCRLQCDALHILSANRVCVAARRSGVQAGVGLRRGDDPPRQHAQEDRLVESSCDASLGQRWPAKGRREHHLLSRGAQRKKSKYRVCTVHISGTYTAYKRKYHKLPVLGDDVTDDEGDSDEGSDDSKEGYSD